MILSEVRFSLDELQSWDDRQCNSLTLVGKLMKYLAAVLIFFRNTTEMQSQLSSITRESESQKRQIDTLKHQMQQKDSEYRQEISHLKLELDVAKRDIGEQRSTVSNLEDRLTEASKKHREAINQKDKEILFVNDQLRSKENELKRHQDEELKRAEMLEKAMYSFVSNTRTGSH